MTSSLTILSILSEKEYEKIEMERELQSKSNQLVDLKTNIEKNNLCIQCINESDAANESKSMFQKFPLSYLPIGQKDRNKNNLDVTCLNYGCNKSLCSIHSPLCIRVSDKYNETGVENSFCGVTCANAYYCQEYGIDLTRVIMFSNKRWKVSKLDDLEFEILRV